MNTLNSNPETQKSNENWVRETRFGRWFLTTKTWYRWVLSEAVLELKQMLNNSACKAPKILDAGCGAGLAFSLLEEHFQPRTIIGVDLDQKQIAIAAKLAERCQCEVKIIMGTVGKLDIKDNTIDIIFCHQLIHHLSQQT